MIKKIISSFLAMWTMTASGQSELQEKSINSPKTLDNYGSHINPVKNVDEYRFKIINWKKIDFEHETDPDILRSYGEYDEGEYPLHLTEIFLPNLYFYSNTPDVEVKFEIFLTINISLRRKNLFKNVDFLQEYFINKYNTCFFYDKDLVAKTNDFSKLIGSINIEDFQNMILPNLIPELIHIIDADSTNRLYYHWDFYRSNGNYGIKGVNLLSLFIDHLPYPNITKVQELEKLQFYAYANIEELANFAPDIELEGLEWNAKYFDDTFPNDIFERSKETVYAYDVTSKYIIKPKSRYLCNELKINPVKIKSNLEILNKWFFDKNNMQPFKIKP